MPYLTSQSCGEVVQVGHGLIGRWSCLKTTWALMNIWHISYSKSSLGNFQHQYLPKLLANYNVYSYISCDGEKYVLLLCVWKPAFLKSSLNWFITYVFYVMLNNERYLILTEVLDLNIYINQNWYFNVCMYMH